MDFRGSFICENYQMPYQLVKKRLESTLPLVFESKESNFLSMERLSDFRVLKGDNNLNSCF